jgi:O-antigen/teichoic acid export membrane protein
MPSGELLAPLNRVLFPAFAAASDNHPELKRLFLLAQGLQTLIAVPAAVGLAMIAEPMTRLVLGEKWLSAVPFLQVLALVNIGQALTTSSGYVLIVLGKVKHSVLSLWALILVFAVLALTVFSGAEALTIAWLRLAVGAFGGIGLLLWLLVRALPGLHFRDVFASSVRPILGGAGMAAVLYFLPVTGLPLAITLAVQIAVGAVAYTGLVWAMWSAMGRPDGAESYLLRGAASVIARRRGAPGGT